MKSTGRSNSVRPETFRLWPEAARILGVGRSTIYEAARRGEIRTIRIGKLLLVPRRALEELLGGAVSSQPEATDARL